MQRRNSLKQRITQRFRVAPILTTSVTGVALAVVVCVIIFLWGNFGNNKNAVAGKNATTTGSSSAATLNSATTNQADTADIELSGNPEILILQVPENITANNVYYSGATLKWKAASGSAYYKVRITPAGQSGWTYYTVKSRQKKVDNLAEGTYYDFQVQAYSKVDSSGWSEPQTFKTGHSCSQPDNLTLGNVTSTSAMVHWMGDPNIVQYAIRYRPQGETEWSDEAVASGHANRFLITGLKPGLTYEWQIRCQCPYSSDSWSDYQPGTFNTLQALEVNNDNLTVSPTLGNQIKVSPNPNNGQFLIELNFGKTEVKTAKMELTNLSGQVILKQNLSIENNLLSESMNVGSNLPQGFYLLKISAGGNVYQTQISLNKE